MAPPFLDALVKLAKTPDPATSLDSGVYLISDDQTLTIFDLYKKAKYHFLILHISHSARLPFVLPNSSSEPTTLSQSDLSSLSSLLKSSHALSVLEKLKDVGEDVKEMIRDEMEKTEGWSWDVQVGFHANESMKHVHLHVISTDFVSDRLKNKKHYNSFRPDLGFFFHIDDVIEEVKAGRNPKTSESYSSILASPLTCYRPHCKKEFTNVPKLKDHLLSEWKEEKKQALLQAKQAKGEENGGKAGGKGKGKRTSIEIEADTEEERRNVPREDLEEVTDQGGRTSDEERSKRRKEDDGPLHPDQGGLDQPVIVIDDD